MVIAAPSIWIPRYASARNPGGIIPPLPASAPAERRMEQDRDWRAFLREHMTHTGRIALPMQSGETRVIRPRLSFGELVRAFKRISQGGLVNGGLIGVGHGLVDAGVIRAASPAVTFIWEDTFTGAAANLTGHTAEVGGGYSALSGSIALDGSGSIVGAGVYSSAAVPPSAVYVVQCIYSVAGVGGTGIVGHLTNGSNFVLAQFQSTAPNLTLWDNVGGSFSLLASVGGLSLNVGDAVELHFVTASTVFARAVIGGVNHDTSTVTTSNTSKGSVGVRSDNSSFKIDYCQAV